MAPHYTIATKKAPNPIDKHVGSRVRMRRMMLAMSQQKLADALGLTFQQVQKYERGANRMGASRLQQMSDILQVPVEFFFEGAPNASAPHGSGSALSVAQIDDFISNSDGLRLIGAFETPAAIRTLSPAWGYRFAPDPDCKLKKSKQKKCER